MSRLTCFIVAVISTVAVILATMRADSANASSGTTAISYATTLPDGAGGTKTVAFEGRMGGSSITGTLLLDGVAHELRARIEVDGSISGTVYRNGATVAAFSGQPDGVRGLRGSFTLNGQGANWELPVTLEKLAPTVAP